MAYLTSFVTSTRPLSGVRIDNVGNSKVKVCLSFSVGEDWFTIHGESMMDLERFHALIGSAIQDHLLKTDAQAVDLGESHGKLTDLSAYERAGSPAPFPNEVA